MKSSFRIRTLATQLSRCHLFSIIFDCRLERLPQLFPQLVWGPHYMALGRIQQKTPFPSL
jgi:hypothetical protein